MYELYLSDAFEKPLKDGKYEWTAKVYNINIGKISIVYFVIKTIEI
mgnify:CR=1 FL=1